VALPSRENGGANHWSKDGIWWFFWSWILIQHPISPRVFGPLGYSL
jgi:hypothetical protein